ncbi:histone deacetylase family protein [Abortiporus biennis]
MSKRRVAYYYDPDVGAFTYGLGHPMKPQRMRITHELVSTYGMLDKMHILRAKRATGEALTRFHTDEYVHFLSKVTPETAEEMTFHGTRFLVGDDNPAWEGIFDFCTLSAGGSIEAAQRIASGATDIAINWAGGLHHAKKREASGFCYINDIVLDCHHGDGVEEAFYTTNRVMTCSFHKYGEYFPGTGTQEDRGRGVGRGYAVNVPLKDGITDESYKSVFQPVISKIIEVFQPSAIVLQCGADSLAGDKLGCFNVTMRGHASCVQFVRKFNIPFMLVGGGGYTVKNVARTWTFETACALGIEDTIDPNLPWNEYFEWFGPRYRLEVVENNMEDLNVKDGSLDRVRETALKHLSQLRPAPSVGLQDVPSESLGDHLGFKPVKRREKHDDLDDKLAQHMKFVYNLQDEESEEESEHEESDSDNSSMIRNGKKRMSIITNQYVDTDSCGHDSNFGFTFEGESGLGRGGVKRKFFQSAARWDDRLRRVLVENGGVDTGSRRTNGDVSSLMVNGGRGNSEVDEEEEMEVDEEEDS